MTVDKETVRYESTFTDDRAHRLSWRKTWNKNKPMITVLMLNPSTSDCCLQDLTSMLVQNAVTKLEKYGSLQIVNLYSIMTPKLNFRWNSDEDLNVPENDDYIKAAVADSEISVIAFGKGSITNKRIAKRSKAVLDMLKDYTDKLYTISDGVRNNLHPLCPSVRSSWDLVPIDESLFNDISEATGDE